MKEVYRRKDELWVNNQRISEFNYKVYLEEPKETMKQYNTYEEMRADLAHLHHLNAYPDRTLITHKPFIIIYSTYEVCSFKITEKNFESAKVITTFEPIRQTVQELLDFLTVEEFAEYCKDRNIENIKIGG